VDLIRARGVAAAVTLAALAAGARRADSQEVGLPLGTPAPAAAVETLDGRPADLARLVAGRPALVEFWATWCSNCKALEPQIAAVAAKYGSRLQVVTVAVSASQSPERVRRYVAAHRTPGVVVYDRAGKATAAYDAPATSYVVLLDGRGRVAYTGQGGDQPLAAAVRRVLPDPPSGGR
jgi:thiol-disulfide isomerase/thioredoxin